MLDFFFHPEASQEYIEAQAWYAERSQQLALEFESEVERGLRLISENPDRWVKYDKIHHRQKNFDMLVYSFDN